MHGVGGEQALFIHPFLNVGEINQSNKFNEKLSFQGTLGRSHRSSEVKPLFYIPERFLNNIPHAVETERSNRILDFVANQDEEAVPFMGGVNSVLLKGEGDSSLWCFLDFKVLAVILLMFRIPFSAQEFRF